MPLRRPARLLAAALLIAAPALTSCGFDYATDRVYTPGAGVNDRDQQVDILGAVVVSAQDGSGTLIATFTNNDSEAATVAGIEGAADSGLTVDGFSEISIPGSGLVNLADEDTPIEVTGDFVSGAFLSLEFTLGDGSTVEMDVPTVPACYEYAGLDATADEPTPLDECQPEPASGAEH